jgi:hypothetical protein
LINPSGVPPDKSEEETVAVLTSADDYAYHIGQVASVGTRTLKVVRKQLSIKSPYTIAEVPMSGVSRAEYKSGLAPLRIVAGVLLLALLAGIAYYLVVYWQGLEPGTTIRVGLLGLAGVYGLKWAFLSRRHEFVFHLQDGGRVRWRSRSGDFKYKQRAVGHVLDHLRGLGLSS